MKYTGGLKMFTCEVCDKTYFDKRKGSECPHCCCERCEYCANEDKCLCEDDERED